MRRLLRPPQVAEKLGMSPETFYRRRADLFARGFPRPVLGRGHHGHARYDDAAIDRWLDLQMDPHLRPVADNPDTGPEIDGLLDRRLEELRI